jgi:hypothetical protein
VIGRVPTAALAGVMIMVAVGTFDWHSLRTLLRMPRLETAVMIVTVVVVGRGDLLSGGRCAGTGGQARELLAQLVGLEHGEFGIQQEQPAGERAVAVSAHP